MIPGEFHCEAGTLHAADVAYALVAARSVLGDILSDEWVVAGHSEGGMTAWRTNERLAMSGQDTLLKAGTLIRRRLCGTTPPAYRSDPQRDRASWRRSAGRYCVHLSSAICYAHLS